MYYYRKNYDSAVHNISWRITEALEATRMALELFRKKEFVGYNSFRNYMYQRTEFYIAKQFAIYKKRDMFDGFLGKYNVRKDMKYLYYKNGIVLTLSAMTLSVSPKLFYRISCCCGKFLR